MMNMKKIKKLMVTWMLMLSFIMMTGACGDDNQTKYEGDFSASVQDTQEYNENEVEGEDGEKTETGLGEENTEQPETETREENTKEPEAISGNVESLGNGSFSMQKAQEYKDAMGADIMVADLNNPEIVTVRYTEQTVFEICTSSDGGITSDYTAGTLSDLQADGLVKVEGVYEGTDFAAQKIIIYHFN